MNQPINQNESLLPPRGGVDELPKPPVVNRRKIKINYMKKLNLLVTNKVLFKPALDFLENRVLLAN